MPAKAEILSVGQKLLKSRMAHGPWSEQDILNLKAIAEEISGKRSHTDNQHEEYERSKKDWEHAEIIYTARDFKPAPEWVHKEKKGEMIIWPTATAAHQK